MARQSPLQTGFTSGEFSPRLLGRVDLERYAFGLAECENFIALRQGPVTFRPGTRFVAEAIDSSLPSRLLPFVFSDEQAYVFELADGKIRVFTLEGVLRPSAKNFETIATNDIIPIDDYTYSEGQGPFLLTTTGTLPTGLSTGTSYYIKRLTNDTFSLSLSPGGPAVSITAATGSGVHTITPNFSLVLEIDVPYLSGQIFDVQHAQTADIMYLAHPAHPPAKIERRGSALWRFETVSFYDGPYLEKNTDSTFTVNWSSSALGAVTLTASRDLFVAGRDEGRHIRNRAGTSQVGYTRIDSVTSTTVAQGTNLRTNAGAGAIADWQLGAWYVGNYPRAVTFHEQRLVFAGAPNQPQRFDGSVIGDFENFAPTGGPSRDVATFDANVVDDNAYAFTLAADRVNAIRWLASARNLLLGTVGGIWPVQASSLLESISPNSINARRSTSRGAASLRPAIVDDTVVYVSASGRRAYSAAYVSDSDSFKARDVTRYADQVLDVSAVQADYAGDDESIFWVVRTDGQLAGLTIDESEEVLAWHRHVLGGSFSGGAAVVESIAVIPAPVGSISVGAHANRDHDQVWMLVKRTVNGVQRRYIEFMEDLFPVDEPDTKRAFFVDCGLTYEGPPTTTISGFGHLEGETVAINVDGSAHAQKVVSGGAVTLDRSGSVVNVGLPYEGRIRTLPLEAAGTRLGPSQGTRKRSDHLFLRLDRTVGLEVARNEFATEWDGVLFRSLGDLLGTPVPLFSDDKVVSAGLGWTVRGQQTFRQRIPFPCTILAVGHRSQASERGVP